MLVLAWDTETSGLPLWSEPSEHPAQPHICQIAAILADADTGKVISSLDLIIKPDGWVIPEETSKIHGITTQHALQVGLPERDVVGLFLKMGVGHIHVAHNSSFDERIMRIALKRHFDDAAADEFKARTFECTAKMATPIVKAPPTAKMLAAGRHHHKTANLAEAYKHFTGQDLVGAHSAAADTQACMAVWFAIRALKARPSTGLVGRISDEIPQ